MAPITMALPTTFGSRVIPTPPFVLSTITNKLYTVASGAIVEVLRGRYIRDLSTEHGAWAIELGIQSAREFPVSRVAMIKTRLKSSLIGDPLVLKTCCWELRIPSR
ncbi:hypothetical protein PM082_001699 [Marasmius tenuissimus]|nr:hypothetical protein PM082_001699 [Marasmius tenuissimus]